MTDEDYLLAALRIAAGTDPVPSRVQADARAVYGLRLPRGVIAAPVRPGADFGAVAPGRTGVPVGVRADGCRTEGTPRLLRFAANGLTIDMEVTVCDSHLDLAGQVHPAPGEGAKIEIRTPHVSKIRFPSEAGEFATTGLPHGWLSVVCHRRDHPPVATRWQCIRR